LTRRSNVACFALMFARGFVAFYCWFHGRLHLPGAGWLLRRLAQVLPALRDYPLTIPGTGVARLDLRDTAAYSLLNWHLRERDDHAGMVALIERCLPPAAVVWDVGANVGRVSLELSRSLKRPAAIHAFEPAPGPRRTLESLFAGHPTVHVHAFGLAAEDSELTIQTCPDNSSLNSLTSPLHRATEAVRVQLRSADRWREEFGLPAPHVIKMDVEGFEPQAFAGLARTVAQAQPIIFYEHILLTEEAIRRLTPPGYTLRFLADDGRLSADFSQRRFGHDAVLTPPGVSLE